MKGVPHSDCIYVIMIVYNIHDVCPTVWTMRFYVFNDLVSGLGCLFLALGLLCFSCRLIVTRHVAGGLPDYAMNNLD